MYRLFDRIAASDITPLNKVRCFVLLQLAIGIFWISCYMAVYRLMRGY